MTDHDPVPQHERDHALRRSIALGIAAFYAVTIVWAITVALAGL